MRSADGGRWRDSDNGVMKGRSAGRGRGPVRMYNLRSTASEKLEGEQTSTTKETGGSKSDIRMYVCNGTELKSNLKRRTTRNKTKARKVTFNENNDAGEDEIPNETNTQGERGGSNDDEIRRQKEIKKENDSKNEIDTATWKLPSKTVRTRGLLTDDSTKQKGSETENAFSILQDDIEMQESDSYENKKGDTIKVEKSIKHTWYESSDDDSIIMARYKKTVSGTKRYHGNTSDEEIKQKKTAKSEDKETMEGITIYDERSSEDGDINMVGDEERYESPNTIGDNNYIDGNFQTEKKKYQVKNKITKDRDDDNSRQYITRHNRKVDIEMKDISDDDGSESNKKSMHQCKRNQEKNKNIIGRDVNSSNDTEERCSQQNVEEEGKRYDCDNGNSDVSDKQQTYNETKHTAMMKISESTATHNEIKHNEESNETKHCDETLMFQKSDESETEQNDIAPQPHVEGNDRRWVTASEDENTQSDIKQNIQMGSESQWSQQKANEDSAMHYKRNNEDGDTGNHYKERKHSTIGTSNMKKVSHDESVQKNGYKVRQSAESVNTIHGKDEGSNGEDGTSTNYYSSPIAETAMSDMSTSEGESEDDKYSQDESYGDSVSTQRSVTYYDKHTASYELDNKQNRNNKQKTHGNTDCPNNLHAYDSDEFIPPEVYNARQNNGENDKTEGNSTKDKWRKNRSGTTVQYRKMNNSDLNQVKVVAVDTTENKIPIQEENTKEILQRRGDIMVEENITQYTPTKIEFNPTKEDRIFNVRQELIELLRNMWLADKNIRVQSVKDNTIWGPSDRFPIGEQFTEHFKVLQTETKFKTNRIILHIVLLSSEELNRLKWRPQVRDYIFNRNIWFREDKFEAQASSTPGYFVGIHPRATNREVFTKYISTVLNNVQREKEKQVVKRWLENNKDEPKVPTFELRIAIRKWGTIHSEVLSIECAKKNAQYMKYMISTAIEQNLLKNVLFIPIGIHLMKSPEVLSSLLRKHNQYIATLTTFEIYGLFPQMLTKPYRGGDTKTIDEYMKESKLIIQREKTPVTDVKGIWTIVVKKTHIREAKELLEQMVPSCTNRPQYRYGNTATPAKSGPEDEIVGSYATYLEKLVTSEGLGCLSDNNREFDVCETLKQRKSYKEILAGNKKNTDQTYPPKESAQIQSQNDKSTLDPRNKSTNKTIDNLNNKIESLETKMEQLISNENIENILKRMLKVNETATNEHIPQGTSKKNADKNYIEQIIDEKFKMLEQKQDQKLLAVSEQITKSILRNMETTLETYQSKMDTVAEIIVQHSQMSTNSDQYFSTQQSQSSTPTRNETPNIMTITPASKVSMSGVGAV